MKTKKDKNYFSIIVGILIILYLIFGTNLLSDLKNSAAQVSNINNKSTTNVSIKDGKLKIYFIEVGQADSILISNNNHNMLIDAGNTGDGKKLVNYFKSLNINSFDYVVGTHPHEDHIGGMDDIIRNFDIKNYYMPEKLSTSKTFEDVLDSLIEKNMQYTVPKIGDVLTLDDAKLNVIYVGDETNDANDSSIILKLTYGNNSALFTGDASKRVEKKILNYDIKSDILKVGHHGSSYSTLNEFLNKVNPKYAVIEVGKNNIYNHPTNDTLDKLSKRNIKVYRTDINGTIIFTLNGNSYNIETINTDTNG
ncbi:MAG: MBL fold metallo-hydrolase [Bacilli bacterium]|nr:MBL fold metallo-hydrolase [Bacilli bacterium]